MSDPELDREMRRLVRLEKFVVRLNVVEIGLLVLIILMVAVE